MHVHEAEKKQIEILTWTTQDNIKVQTIDSNRGVILDTKINVFLDTKAKVAGVAEVVLPQLVLPDFEAPLKNLLRLGSTDCAVDGNLFVTANTERTHSVTCLGENRLLARQLFQHLDKKYILESSISLDAF